MKKYINIYLLGVFIIASLLFFIPINLFDGEVHYKYEILDYTVKQKMSLSQFIGIGANPMETEGVVDFHLLPIGYFLAVLMIFFFPAIISYRWALRDKSKNAT
jgi:hypothetical protein